MTHYLNAVLADSKQTLISKRNINNNFVFIIQDEDCWIGELNGLRGWFPAKFVQLLDERSKQYSSAGDDSVNENVAHLVRGTLAPTIKQVLEHGMKKASILGNNNIIL